MLFHRVDDIGEDAACDVTLMETFEAARVPYIIAVIPKKLTSIMASRIRVYKFATVFQHGLTHENAVTNSRDYDEFPEGSPNIRELLSEGKNRLESAVGLPVLGYTPPWNNASPTTLRHLEGLGFRWFSGHARNYYATSLAQFNVEIDPVRRYRPPVLHRTQRVWRKALQSAITLRLTGVVFHPQMFPPLYLQEISAFVLRSRHFSCSLDAWKHHLNSQGAE